MEATVVATIPAERENRRSSTWDKVLCSGNLLWHASACWLFMLRTRGMLRRFTRSAGPNPLAEDVVKFLGGLNMSLVLVALVALRSRSERLRDLYTILAVANWSQFFWDIIAHRSGRFKYRFAQITVIDGLFGLADTIAAILPRK
eukprot:TRINITY_DN12598_c0_g1_i1.p1 TRINITY_DN12598_c0_g1~~TRINITY_DN12598_c0_g1_i1.p1  ORF type:complete len:159 (-),score=20.15 TRINITY_DN12598_c0_g1_i1:322-756(-)